MENEKKDIGIVTDEQKSILTAFDQEPKADIKPINPLDEPIGILDGVDDPDTTDPLYEYNHNYNKQQRLTEAWNKPMLNAVQTWLNLTHKNDIETALSDPSLMAQLLDEFLSTPSGQEFGWETRKKPEVPFPYDPNERVIGKLKTGQSKGFRNMSGEDIDNATNTFTTMLIDNFKQGLMKAYASQGKSSSSNTSISASNNDDDILADSDLSPEDTDELLQYVDDNVVDQLTKAASKAVAAQQFTQDDINNSKYIDLFDATVNFLRNTLGKRLMIVAGGPGLGKSYTIADAVDTVMNGGQPGLFKKCVQSNNFYPIIQSAIPTSGATRGKKDRFLYKRGGENFVLDNFISWMFAHRANYCCVLDDADKYLTTSSTACQNLLKGFFGDGEPAKVDWSSEISKENLDEETIMSFDVDKLQEQGILDVYKNDKLICSEEITTRKELWSLCEEFGGKPTAEALKNAKRLEEAAGMSLPDDDDDDEDDVDFDTSSFDPTTDADANISGNGVTNANADDPIDDMFEEEEAEFRSKSGTKGKLINRIPKSFAFSSRIMFITNANERKLNGNPDAAAVYQRSYHVNMDLTNKEFMARLNSIRPFLGKETKKSHEDVIVEAAKKVVWTIYGLAAAKADALVPFIFSGDDAAFNRNASRCKIDGLVANAKSFRVFESLVNSLTIQIDSAIQKGYVSPQIESGETEDDYINRLGMSGIRYNDYQWFKSQAVPCFKATFQGIKRGKGDI